MRVLFRIRADIARFPGGDEVQLRRTREALETLGVETALLPGVAQMPAGFDLVHLFNTTRIHETAVQFDQARRQGVPVVVSPIWHSNAEMSRFYAHQRGWPWFPLTAYQALKEAYYARRGALRIHLPSVLRFRGLQRAVCAGAAALLPNSGAELRILRAELGITPRASFVIPHGFDIPSSNVPSARPRRDVICAGRIEPRKNQLGVVRAFKRLPRSGHVLRLFGAFNETHAAYARQVRAEMVPGWVEYAGCVRQKDIFAAYSSAAVVVLASFFETCGLVIGEALSSGAHACASRSLYVEEHYREAVEYCDPYEEASIAGAISAALQRPFNDSSKWTYTSWTDAAEMTRRAYEQVIAKAHFSSFTAYNQSLVSTIEAHG